MTANLGPPAKAPPSSGDGLFLPAEPRLWAPHPECCEQRRLGGKNRRPSWPLALCAHVGLPSAPSPPRPRILSGARHRECQGPVGTWGPPAPPPVSVFKSQSSNLPHGPHQSHKLGIPGRAPASPELPRCGWRKRPFFQECPRPSCQLCQPRPPGPRALSAGSPPPCTSRNPCQGIFASVLGISSPPPSFP